MIRLIFTTLSFLFVSINSHAQKPLNLEEQLINSYEKDSLSYDFIASLCAIDSSMTVGKIARFKTNLDNFIYTLPSKEEKQKRESKRIQKIYNEVHDTYFTKYKDVAYFPDIFDSGVYNCVTATALYAYIFDEIKVPYAIKDAPGHVYLIAYPTTNKIVLETTAPGVYGFRKPKDAEVRENVEQLVALKLVTAEEVASKGESVIFMEYFYGKEHLEKAALVGMQYYNKALTLIEKEQNQEALREIQKSLIFFPYAPSEFLYKSLIGVSLSEMEFNDKTNLDYLIEMFNTLKFDKDYHEKDVQYYMYQLTQHDDNDLHFIDTAAAQLSAIKNKKARSIAKDMLYEYVARKSADLGETERALTASDSVLVYNPKSKIAKEIIAFVVGKKMSLSGINKVQIDKMDNLYAKYDFLNGNIKIESLRAILYGRMAHEEFRNKNPELAREYLVQFETLMDAYGNKLEINPDATIALYLKAGRYYYGKTINDQALKFFSKGLDYHPDNPDLKKMKRWVLEDMN